MSAVRIYKLSREFDWTAWLCPVALARWLEVGWQIRGETKDAPHTLTCDDRASGCCTNDRFGLPIAEAGGMGGGNAVESGVVRIPLAVDRREGSEARKSNAPGTVSARDGTLGLPGLAQPTRGDEP